MTGNVAGKKAVRCQVCGTKCFRLQFQQHHLKGIKKEYRDVPGEERPEGAREKPRYGAPRYVHCHKCGRPRDLRGHPLPPEKTA